MIILQNVCYRNNALSASWFQSLKTVWLLQILRVTFHQMFRRSIYEIHLAFKNIAIEKADNYLMDKINRTYTECAYTW